MGLIVSGEMDMKCIKCGHEVPESNKFCEYCGTEVEPERSDKVEISSSKKKVSVSDSDDMDLKLTIQNLIGNKKIPLRGGGKDITNFITTKFDSLWKVVACIVVVDSICFLGTILFIHETLLKLCIMLLTGFSLIVFFYGRFRASSLEAEITINKVEVNELQEKQKQFAIWKTSYIFALILGGIVFGGMIMNVLDARQQSAYHIGKAYINPRIGEMFSDNKYSYANSELSINGVSLGDSWTSVKDKLGTPIEPMIEAPNTQYIFEDVEVSVDGNNDVLLLVSNSHRGTTKRGVHVGDTERTVIEKYGRNFSRSTFENMILYEYTYDGPGKAPAILRFAIDNHSHRITYISVRFQ